MAIPTPAVKPSGKPPIKTPVVKIPGGRVQPKAPKAPKRTTPRTPITGAPRAAPLTPQQTAEGMFRETLAQIRAGQTPLDTGAIARPYQDASVAAGQLGAGLQKSVLASGQAAQDQYTQSRDQAMQHGAAFGISSGAGASAAIRPGELDGNSTLAQLTQAEGAAAGNAGGAWQALLGRLQANAVSKATAERAASDQQTEASLASNIPQWQQNAETLNFQKQSAKENNAYLRATLTAKQLAAMRADETRRRGQDMQSETAASGQAAQDARLTRTIAQAQQHDKLTQKGLNTRAANVAKRTGNSAGLTQILSVLKPTKGGKVQVGAGWTAYVQPIDPATGKGYGTVQTMPGIKDVRASRQGLPGAVPKTFVIVSAKPNLKTIDGPSKGVTLAAWNKAVAIAMDQRHLTKAQAQQFIQGLTPRPSK